MQPQGTVADLNESVSLAILATTHQAYFSVSENASSTTDLSLLILAHFDAI